MAERILIINDKKNDFNVFEQILGQKGFDIDGMCLFKEIEAAIRKNAYSAVLADYDFIYDTVYDWLRFFQESGAGTCLILYGEQIETADISDMLWKGVYGFIPRPLLSERLYGTVLGGLENRKTFVKILAIMDELKHVNKSLEKEKDFLRKKIRS